MSKNTPTLHIDSHGDRWWTITLYPHDVNGPRDLHREDGPAIEKADGSRYWFINGDLHREDGPAIELADGTRYWYLSGKKVQSP